MSHFTSIKTQMVEREYLTRALRDLGYECREGRAEIRGYGGKRAAVEISVPTRNPGFDLGFRKAGGSYELVADWWGIRDLNRDQLVRQLTQRYAYHATVDKLGEQGFAVASEETGKDGRIHLVLRRVG